VALVAVVVFALIRAQTGGDSPPVDAAGESVIIEREPAPAPVEPPGSPEEDPASKSSDGGTMEEPDLAPRWQPSEVGLSLLAHSVPFVLHACVSLPAAVPLALTAASWLVPFGFFFTASMGLFMGAGWGTGEQARVTGNLAGLAFLLAMLSAGMGLAWGVVAGGLGLSGLLSALLALADLVAWIARRTPREEKGTWPFGGSC
jgi:hypothetical protein